jgi:uroporphyrinogen decarboxylase
MTGLERVLTTLRHEEPDQVPLFELIINEPIIKALHGNVTALDFVELEGLDACCIFENFRVTKEIDPKTFVDEWGITWRMGDAGIHYPVGGPIRTQADLDRLKPPDPDADYRLDNLRQAVKRFKGEKAIFFLGHETFEFSHYLLGGMDKLFLAYIEDPELVDRLSEVIWAYKGKVLANAAAAGADVLMTGDDVAYRSGPIMSPEHFRRYVLPYLKKAVDLSHSLGKPFIKHTDGNLWPILDDLMGTGLDGLDPLEPLAHMDIGEVKRAVGDRITLVGNVDCAELLPRGTEAEVVEAVKETVAKASPGGGHILASSNSLHPAVNPANYRAMVRTARTFGRYPLERRFIEQYARRNYVYKYLDQG